MCCWYRCLLAEFPTSRMEDRTESNAPSQSQLNSHPASQPSGSVWARSLAHLLKDRDWRPTIFGRRGHARQATWSAACFFIHADDARDPSSKPRRRVVFTIGARLSDARIVHESAAAVIGFVVDLPLILVCVCTTGKSKFLRPDRCGHWKLWHLSPVCIHQGMFLDVTRCSLRSIYKSICWSMLPTGYRNAQRRKEIIMYSFFIGLMAFWSCRNVSKAKASM
jgi:hypothetical protein